MAGCGCCGGNDGGSHPAEASCPPAVCLIMVFRNSWFQAPEIRVNRFPVVTGAALNRRRPSAAVDTCGGCGGRAVEGFLVPPQGVVLCLLFVFR